MRTPKSFLSPENVLTSQGRNQISWELESGNNGNGSSSQWELQLRGCQDNELNGNWELRWGEEAERRWQLVHRDGEGEGQVQGRWVCSKNFIASYHVPSLCGCGWKRAKNAGQSSWKSEPGKCVGNCAIRERKMGSQHVFGPSCVPGRPYLGKLSLTVLINPQPTREMVLFFPFCRQWSERLSDFPKVTLLRELQSQDLNPGLILLLFLLCLNFDFL